MYKNKRKGFTLIELLGTIVVLGIIATITIVAIVSVINSSKKKGYLLTENNILTTALAYAKENGNSFYKDLMNNTEYQCITVQELMDLGYFKVDIVENKILNDEKPISVTPEMVTYIERDADTKVFAEGHLIKDESDEYNTFCGVIYNITCPTLLSYSGVFDNEEHTITVSDSEDLTLQYRTDSESTWTNTLPTRKNAGNTSVFIQASDETGMYKYCGKSNINISKKEVTKPECNNKTYNGENQIILSKNESELINVNGFWNDSLEGINAKTYTQTIHIDFNYKWDDNTDVDYVASCVINPKPISVIWSGGTSFIYNGSEQGPSATADTGVTNETMTLNTTKATEVGEHTSIATCTGVSGGQARCDNYELNDKTKEYSINKNIQSVTIPTNSYCISRTYNGQEQILTNTPGSEYTFSNNEQTNAGTYTITATLKQDYVWSDDGTTEDKTFTCSIKKKEITVTWSGGTSFTYNGSEQGPSATADTGVTNETMTLNTTKATEVGDYTSTATCTGVSGGQKNCDNYELNDKTKEYSINYKKYYLTFNLNGLFTSMTKGGESYTGSATFYCTVTSGDTCDMTVPIIDNGFWILDTSTIYNSGANIRITSSMNGSTLYAHKKANIPTNTYCISRTYNGQEQILTNTPESGYTFSNNEQTNAKNYRITATLKDGYVWSDGTITAKSFDCSISKKQITVTADNKEITHGDGAPAYSYSINGLISGDTLSGTATYTVKNGTTVVSNVSDLSAGTYKIEVNGFSNLNYSIEYSNGSLIVKPLTYTITYYANGGTIDKTKYAQQTVIEGSNYTIPTFSGLEIYKYGDTIQGYNTTNGFKTAYNFKGWSTTQNGNAVYCSGTEIKNIQSNISLYAKWDDSLVYPTITYNTSTPHNIYRPPAAGNYAATDCCASLSGTTTSCVSSAISTVASRNKYPFKGILDYKKPSGTSVFNKRCGIIKYNYNNYTEVVINIESAIFEDAKTSNVCSN